MKFCREYHGALYKEILLPVLNNFPHYTIKTDALYTLKRYQVEHGTSLAQCDHLTGASVEAEVKDSGRVASQLEGAGQLLELAAAAELDFPDLKQD